MSRVYFHFDGGNLEVWGGERAWLGLICDGFLRMGLGLTASYPRDADIDHWLGLYTRRNHLHELWATRSIPNPRHMQDHIATSLSVGMLNEKLKIAGSTIAPFDLALNTAIATGSDPVKLAARIHGQCEVHGYFPPESWEWLQDTIEEGLRYGIFRRWTHRPCSCTWKSKKTDCEKCHGTGRGERMDIGWQELLKFLTEEKPQLLVMSYSVCEQFPPRAALPHSNEEDPEWEDRCATWSEGVKWLLEQGPALSINDESIDQLFSADVTAWMHDVEKRIASNG